MHYLKIGKNDFLIGAMLILSVSGLFVSYITPFGILAAFTLFSVAMLYRPRPISVTFLDVAVCLVTAYELLLPQTSINPPPAYLHTMMGFYLFFCYFLLRLCLISVKQFRTILLILSIAISFILVIGINSVVQLRHRVLQSGFDSVYEFRHLITPWGNPNNMWTTFLIAFSGIILTAYFHYRSHRKITGFLLIVFALLIWNCLGSFSRTTYILMILMLIATIIVALRAKNCRSTLLLGTFIFTVAGFCVLNGTKDIVRTLSMNTTSSQQRSIDARCRDYSLLRNTLTNNTLFGVGSGNYTLAVNDELYEDDNISYTNFASSGLAQLLTEKGILGTLLWLILLISAFISLTSKHSPDAILTIGILILLILKEVTFAVFADFPNLQCLFLILLVGTLNTSTKISPPPILSEKKIQVSYIPIATLFIIYFTAFIVDYARGSKSDSLITRIESGNLSPETYQIHSDNTPAYLLNQASLQWESYLHTNDRTHIAAAIHCLQLAIARNPYDNMPRYNLALLYLHQNQTAEATPILQQLVAQYPNNSLYRIGLAQLLFKQGDISQSAKQYARAIVINPKIMDDPEWKSLKTGSNYKLFSYICNELQYILPNNIKNPIQQAKNGKILWEMSDTVHSERLLRQAVTLQPNLGKAWYNLGLIATAQQDYTQAKIYFKKALLFIPDDQSLLNYVNGEDISPVSLSAKEEYYIQSRMRVYDLKYRTWYKIKPYKTQIYLTSLFAPSSTLRSEFKTDKCL